MQKLKRILAFIGIILLVGMYLATLVLALTSSPAAQNMLMAAIGCTIIVPCVLYAIILVARVLGDRRASDENETRKAAK